MSVDYPMRPTRPSHPSVAELRDVTQPPEVRRRGTAEHWTGDLYMRRLSPHVTRMLLRTTISANGVTWLMILSGWVAGLVLVLPGLLAAFAAVVFTQLQMMWDACDGEVARWRRTSSAVGIFLDKLGHYTVETLIAFALGVRAAGGLGKIDEHLGWLALGAILAWLLALNKALNDLVHVSRATAGLDKLPDTNAVRAPRSPLLATLRRAAGIVPFHRIYHSIELTLIVLAVALVDAARGDLAATRVLVAVLPILALLSVVGHALAILTSSRLRAS